MRKGRFDKRCTGSLDRASDGTRRDSAETSLPEADAGTEAFELSGIASPHETALVTALAYGDLVVYQVLLRAQKALDEGRVDDWRYWQDVASCLTEDEAGSD